MSKWLHISFFPGLLKVKIDLKFFKFIKDFFQDTSIYPPSFKKHGIL